MCRYAEHSRAVSIGTLKIGFLDCTSPRLRLRRLLLMSTDSNINNLEFMLCVPCVLLLLGRATDRCFEEGYIDAIYLSSVHTTRYRRLGFLSHFVL